MHGGSACAGSVLDGVQYALTEVSAFDMPKKHNKTFGEIGLEYLQTWEALGFEAHVCDDVDCFGKPAMLPAEAVPQIEERGNVNVLMLPRHAEQMHKSNSTPQ